MQKLLAFLSVAVLLAGSAFAAEPPSDQNQAPDAASARPWPHEQSDLRPDPTVIWGKLDNGLRYAVLPTKTAPARGSLRMFVSAGSAMEEDDQQGVAHFLEHMAFNGTKHFKPGEAFEYFQRLGMAFGAHTNALTEIDRTVYHLELPRANEELTADGLKLFRDFLDGMLLDEDEIEKERGVVLSELVARNTAAYRTAVDTTRSSLAGTRAADRMPLGKAESVRNLKRDRFVDFYETWYTPGRTMIVAVGDFDSAMVERLIRSRFGDAKARRGETVDPALGKLIVPEKIAARYNRVADASSVTVSLSAVQPAPEGVENSDRFRSQLVKLLTQRMVNHRIGRLVNQPESPIQVANLADENYYNLSERNHFSALCRPEHCVTAITVLEQEMRRALTHGFTPGELETAKDQLTSLLRGFIGAADTRQPADLADELVKMVKDRMVFSHPRELEPYLADYVPTIRTTDCDAYLRKIWNPQTVEISVSGDVSFVGDAKEEILAAYRRSSEQTVEALLDETTNEFAFTDYGPAGEIVSRREHADLGVIEVEFANHVRVNIKPTTFEKSRVQTLIRFGGGLLELPADRAGLQSFAQAVFIAGGLSDVPFDQLSRQLAGSNAVVNFNVSDDAFVLGGPCLASTLELQLQICAAFLTRPGYGAETQQQFFEAMDATYAQNLHTLEGKMRFDVNAFLRSDDPRFVLPSREALHRLTLDDVRAWLAKPLAQGYMEVTLVGDVDPEQALALLAKTLGALPARDSRKPAFAEARRLRFPAKVADKTIHYDSDTPRAAFAMCWPMPGYADLAQCRRLSVLNEVFADRLRATLREELGAAYTPVVVYNSSDVYPDYGFMAAQLAVSPEQLDAMGPLVAEVAAGLAKGPISDDEFERTMKPAMNDLDAQLRNNAFWLGAICDCQERPKALDALRSRTADYAAIRKSELEALAKQYLTADTATTLCVAPAAAATTVEK